MNGYSGKKRKIDKDKIRDVIAATRTLKVVAFFQNKATKKITKIPGVKNPVKF
jgi:phosphoribosylanthranilate isomerase